MLADLSDGMPSETLVGESVDLTSLGNLRSWTNAEASPLIQKLLSSTGKSKELLRLSELPDSGDQWDVGVEWPEFRTIDKVVIRFSVSDRAAQADTTLIQYWKGLSPWQGEWKSLENGFMAAVVNRENGAWTYSFAPCRSCNVRMVVQGKDSKERIELESFSVYGTSQWKSGDVRIEWRHSDQKYNSEGKLEVYNGQVLKLTPFAGTQLRGPFDWSSAGGGGKISGIVVRRAFSGPLERSR
jgi:hypothetical protein